jgi:hypothetical protein
MAHLVDIVVLLDLSLRLWLLFSDVDVLMLLWDVDAVD